MSEDLSIFEKILAKKIPATIVFENEVALAFHDIQPVAPIHILVIPKKKLVNLLDSDQVSPGFLGEYLKTITEVAKKLQLDDNGFRVVFNTGEHGGQTVPYLHAHILAGRKLQWPPG